MSRAPRIAALAVLLASLGLAVIGGALAPASAAGRSLAVVYADGRQKEDVPLLKLEKDSEELFVSAFDLARIFKATKLWNPDSRKLVLRIGERRYMFTIDTRVVLVDDEAILMRVPARYESGVVMVPLEFISAILVPRAADKIVLDEKRMVLSIGSPSYNLTAIRLVDDAAGSRAVLSLTEELLYHMDSETPGLLRLKIYGGRLNPSTFAVPKGKGLFNQVRAEQMEHDAYLFFDVKQTVQRYRVEFQGAEAGSPEKGAKQLVLFLERGKLPEIPEADFAGKRMVEMVEEGAKRKPAEPLKKIAIDAGHGGTDNGRTSLSGFLEKNVNLQIATLLADRLREELGVDVVMTRTEDTLIAFDQRVETANVAGANLFISIHCNGWFTSDAGGFEAFFLAPARTEEEASLARAENASSAFEGGGTSKEDAKDIDFILWDMAQNQYITESSDLAEMVQLELSKELDIKNRGVKQAGLRVLKGLAMPGVLIEVAFLSNPHEEKLLMEPAFRDKVVEAIIVAVKKFQSRHNDGTAAP
jgi:N-acetylmuramoyl-L-alanine amidase